MESAEFGGTKMRLNKSSSKNSCIYYAVETVRDKSGKKTTRVYERIGTYAELLERGIKDPEEYARKRIEEINSKLEHDVLDLNIQVDFSENLESTSSTTESVGRNIGWLYLKNIMDQLRFEDFGGFKETKAQYDAVGMTKHVVASRIMWPESKKASWEHSKRFLGVTEYALHDVYRYLGLVAKNMDELQAHLFRNTKRIIGIDDSVLYYDCTNFYFETETQDENTYDDSGDIIQWGFRRYGASKEHRPNPIVQMGLFTDKKGMPISFCISHGSNSEQNTVIPLEQRMIKNYKTSRFIYCSDAGLGSTDNRAFNAVMGRDYIVTHSLKKTEKAELDRIMKDLNWQFIDDNGRASLAEMIRAADKKIAGEELTADEETMLARDIIYKSYPMVRKVNASLFNQKLKGKLDMEETLHVTFSVKYYIYQRTIFNRQLEAAANWLDRDVDSIKKGPNDIRRFIKTISATKSGEAATETRNVIDQEVMEKEKRFHGFYAVATSLDSPIQEILEINAGRWRIEQSFRIMKSEFDSRPAYVSTEDHIKGHFALCYIALLVYRILEEKLKEKNQNETYTTSQILRTIKNMDVIEKADNGYFESIYTGSKTLDALEKTFGLGLNKKYYKSKTLNNHFKN